MSRIGSWNKVVDKKATTVKNSGVLSGTVKEWVNRTTGQRVEIRFQQSEAAGYADFYEIVIDGSSVEGFSSISRAYDSVIDMLKHFPHGGL